MAQRQRVSFSCTHVTFYAAALAWTDLIQLVLAKATWATGLGCSSLATWLAMVWTAWSAPWLLCCLCRSDTRDRSASVSAPVLCGLCPLCRPPFSARRPASGTPLAALLYASSGRMHRGGTAPGAATPHSTNNRAGWLSDATLTPRAISGCVALAMNQTRVLSVAQM